MRPDFNRSRQAFESSCKMSIYGDGGNRTRATFPPNRSELVLDGFACLVCGRLDGAMEPAIAGPRGQIFAHPDCRPAP